MLFNAAEIGVDTDKTGITQTKRQTVNPGTAVAGDKNEDRRLLRYLLEVRVTQVMFTGFHFRKKHISLANDVR
ncbi:hypothetical protein NUKP84_38740 [Klebsiella variicola]|nr:hypothetical protein NUKP84_38740 [Klebsiella variicola]